MRQLSFVLNGDRVETWVDGSEMLLEVLREKFSLFAAREGCGLGECGACTVLVDGLNVNSCLFPALEVEGRRVETVEGLAGARGFTPLQQAFLEYGASQCGFCTPGMLISAQAFLAENPGRRADEHEIRRALAGNLCRCTGYFQIVEAVRAAMAREEEENAG